MKKIVGKRMWIKVLAVVLALSLNLGAMDGIIKAVMQEWSLGTFTGFLRPAAAQKVASSVYTDIEMMKMAAARTSSRKPQGRRNQKTRWPWKPKTNTK